MDEPMKKWVQALRSGEYRQARGRLKKGNAFCCLGVACDALKDHIGGNWVGQIFQIEGGISSDATLPVELSRLLELEVGVIGLLINMNDRQFKNFNQIADYLETL
jgi:hypothetical protein